MTFYKQIEIVIVIFILNCTLAIAGSAVDTNLSGMQEPVQESNPSINKSKKSFGIDEDEEKKIQNYSKVSLIDVILETISNNHNLKAQREKVRRAQINLDDGYAGYKPMVDVEYSYGKNYVTPGSDSNVSGTFDYKDENLKLVLRQNLYSGGATEYKIKALEKSLEVSKNRYELAISQEIQNAIKAYFGVVFSSQSYAITKKNMEMLRKILEIVTIKYELGDASIGDISSIKASVANAESKLSQTNLKFVEALKYYEYIVGEDFKYTLPYEFEYAIKIDSLDELLQKGNQKNLNIVSYQTTVKSEEYKLKAVQSGFKPKVDLSFTQTKTFDKDIAFEENNIEDTSEILLSLKYNLYNGGRDSNAIVSSYSTIRELNYQIEQERRKIKWIISDLFQSLSMLEGAISSTKQEVDSSELMVSSYWEAFQNGEQDLQILLIAQRQLNSAQVSLIESYQNRLNDYFKLLFETGELVSFFDLDPTKENFIDFTKSKYNNKYAKDAELVNNPLAFATMDILTQTPDVKTAAPQKEIKKVDTLEDILMFKDIFLDANDSDFTIFISSFDSVYDTFAFIKEHNATKQAFIVDMIEQETLKNAMAYGIYSSSKLANNELASMKKAQNKNYEVVSIAKIKELYKKFLDALSELQPKEIAQQKEVIKTKIVKLVPKLPQPYFTNKDFKQKFLKADKGAFTINLTTFTKLDDAIALIDKEQISNKTFVLRYGTNAEWIKILYGVFATYEEAQAGVGALSAQTKEKYYPIVENIKDKQELSLKYNHLELGTPSSSFGDTEYIQISEEKNKN